jgi:hypothetical protein
MLSRLIYGAEVAVIQMSHFGGTGLQELKRRIASHNSGVYKASDFFKAAGRNLQPQRDRCKNCTHGHWGIDDSYAQGGTYHITVSVRCDRDCANK